MYDTTTPQKKTIYNSESKYVADILSSMADGAPLSLAYSLPAYVSGVTTVTTPTLTPTTLANLEQTFIELQSVPVSTPTQDPLTQSGFVPPVVHPNSDPNSSSSEGDGYDYDSSQDSSDWSGPISKRARPSLPGTVIAIEDGPFTNIGGGVQRKTGRGRRHFKDDSLTPDELQRREVRRERNKVAAAKCRQRRVDHTNRLIGETEKLEDEKSNLETEITSLQQQKDQLQFILHAHQPLCKVPVASKQVPHNDKSPVKNEYHILTGNPQSVVNLVPISSLDSSTGLTNGHVITNGHVNALSATSIKQEVLDYSEYGNQPHIIKVTESMISRPNSLALSSGSLSSLTDTPSVFLTSPSFFAGLDSIVDVSSGLTPITSGPSCRSQLHRDSGDSSPEGMGSSTLISL